VPLLILRPAIIICSQAEPYPGWIDSLAAAGSLSILAGIGIMHFFYCENTTRSDLVPVDMVSNAIIIGTAYQANKNSLTVIHSNTSHANPITWRKYGDYFTEYLKTQPFELMLRYVG
jgi:fatty acyl-CoA reductase